MTPDALSPDDSVTAAELALGLLDGAERADAVRRCLSEPAFAREVELWRDRFATMFVEIRDERPEDGVAKRVLALTDGRARPWRFATVLASLAAAAAITALVMRPEVPGPVRIVQAPAPPAPLVAAMAPTEKGTPFSAVYEPGSGRVRITLVLDVPAERDAQLWWIGADGVPHSIGLLKRDGTSAVTVPQGDRERLGSGATLAVSIEPLGGSPKPVPTGPVVATGALTRI